MIYSNEEMRDMLIDYAGVYSDAIDVIVKVLGDTPQTYKKILSVVSQYKTFSDLEKNFYIAGDEEK